MISMGDSGVKGGAVESSSSTSSTVTTATSTATAAATTASSKTKIPLPPGCKWHAFISHYQATGADQASNLALALEAEGWVVWYDQNADMITVDGMREGVNNSAVFILFLSNGVTTRPFVQFEMRTALEAKLPWFLIHEDDERHGKFIFSEFSDPKTFTLKTVGVLDHGDDELILSVDAIKAIGSTMESLTWRRRGYEKKSLLSELTRRYGERGKFVPKFGPSGTIAAATTEVTSVVVGKATSDICDNDNENDDDDDDEISTFLRTLELQSCASLLRRERFETLETLRLATAEDLSACGIKRAEALRIYHSLHRIKLHHHIISGEGKLEQISTGMSTNESSPHLDSMQLTVSQESSPLPAPPQQSSNNFVATSSSFSSCQQCGKNFGVSCWKHHCRRCRRMLCDKCSPFKARLLAEGESVRVCGTCFEALTGFNNSVNATIDTTATGVVGNAKLLKKCVHLKDMDENGVFYFLGARLGTDTWMDPCVRGFASVCASSEGHGLASSLLSRRHHNRFHTKDERSAWVCVELKRGISVTPRAYTLIHGDGWDSLSMRTPRRLRHWRLEGVSVSFRDATSVVGVTKGGGSEEVNGDHSAPRNSGRGLLDADWVTLRNHVDDCGLNGPWSTHTWPLQVEGQFKAFRIVITDKNSLGLDYEITVGGIEIYGDIYQQSDR